MPRNFNSRATGLPIDTPETICTVDGDKSPSRGLLDCATGYARVEPDPSGVGGVVRLDLIAELSGYRSRVASAFLPIPIPGVAATDTHIFAAASGFLADSWHIAASTDNLKAVVSVALACSLDCCAPRSVYVPPEYTVVPVGTAAAARVALSEAQGVVPAGVFDGQYVELSTVTSPGNYTALPGSRLTRLHADASGSNGAISLTDVRGNVFAMTIDAQESNEWQPRGTYPIAAASWSNLRHILIEMVR
jgi:hypothetical protein